MEGRTIRVPRLPRSFRRLTCPRKRYHPLSWSRNDLSGQPGCSPGQLWPWLERFVISDNYISPSTTITFPHSRPRATVLPCLPSSAEPESRFFPIPPCSRLRSSHSRGMARPSSPGISSVSDSNRLLMTPRSTLSMGTGRRGLCSITCHGDFLLGNSRRLRGPTREWSSAARSDRSANFLSPS